MRKIGINFSGVPEMTLEDSSKMIRDIGFDCVFTGFKNHEKTVEFANAFAGAGLCYESIHAPFNGINNIWFEGEEGDTMLARLIECMDSCAMAGIPILVVHLSSGTAAPHVCDTGRARWDTFIEHAVKTGVTIAFENQRKLANLAFAIERYKKVEQVKFCWDCGHESCFTPGLEYMPIPMFSKRLVYTHVHDNFGPAGVPKGGDAHYMPFDGCINYWNFAEHIKKSGFKGTMTLEISGMNSSIYAGKYTPETFYKRAYGRALKLVHMCDGYNVSDEE